MVMSLSRIGPCARKKQKMKCGWMLLIFSIITLLSSVRIWKDKLKPRRSLLSQAKSWTWALRQEFQERRPRQIRWITSMRNLHLRSQRSKRGLCLSIHYLLSHKVHLRVNSHVRLIDSLRLLLIKASCRWVVAMAQRPRLISKMIY